MQEARKSQIQDLRAEPAWNIDLGKRIHARDFPGLRRLTAAANSSCLKGSEMLWPSGVAICHRSDSFLLKAWKTRGPGPEKSWHAFSIFDVSRGGNFPKDLSVRRQKRFQSAMRKF